MPNIHVTCPACLEELEVAITIGDDCQGEPPYTMYYRSLDGYTIDWAGHTECQSKLAVHVAEEYTRCGLDDLDDIVYARFEEYIKEGGNED